MRSDTIKKIINSKFNQLKINIYLLKKNALTKFALYSVLVLVLIAIFVPIFLPADIHINQDANPAEKLLSPSLEHPFGTDELGRDIFKRVLLGTKISLKTALLAVGAAILIGVPIGAIAGYFGGFLDELLMRFTDIFLGFPSLLLAIGQSREY